MLSLVIKTKKLCYYHTDNSDNSIYMANPFFSGRIPQELSDKAEEYSKQSGKSKTDILIEALSLYLNFPIEVKRTVNDNEELWKAIKDLQEKVEKLETGSNKISVITPDNRDNTKINISPGQLSLLEENKEIVESTEKSLKGKLLEINEILSLPGLKSLDHEKLITKLRNARSQNRLPIQIGKYLIGDGGKNPERPRSVLWKIISDNN